MQSPLGPTALPEHPPEPGDLAEVRSRRWLVERHDDSARLLAERQFPLDQASLNEVRNEVLARSLELNGQRAAEEGSR